MNQTRPPVSAGKSSLRRSTSEMWELVIAALQQNYQLRSTVRRIGLPHRPGTVLIVTLEAEESAQTVKTCVERWLAAKSPDGLDRLLSFLFGSSAEDLAAGPSGPSQYLADCLPEADVCAAPNE